MLATRVGFAGGTSAGPTYHARGDHAEAVEIDFDPARISYRQLLDVFWSLHDPTLPPPLPAYRSGIYVHDRTQLAAALAAKARLEKRLGERVTTEIAPAGTFTLASDAQQKFYLRRHPGLVSAYLATNPPDAVAAAVAARLNAASGPIRFAPARIGEQLSGLGLAPEAVATIVAALPR